MTPAEIDAIAARLGGRKLTEDEISAIAEQMGGKEVRAARW